MTMRLSLQRFAILWSISCVFGLPSVVTGTSSSSSSITTSDSSMNMNGNTPPVVKSVVVVGGTHGNEYTGIWCIKALDRQLQQKTEKKESFTFNLSTMLGNPEAYMQNKRFVDQDLNRRFSYEALTTENESDTVEAKRAKELDQILGPKFGGEDNPPKTDVLIDLHTTTTNMGTTVIVGEGDPLMTAAAAYVMHKCKQDNVCVLMHTHKRQQDRPHVSSIAPHSLSIEVGPVAQGLLRHDAVDKTQRALAAVLEFLERHNTHPDKLRKDLQEYYPSGAVPCYRSAPAQRKGEMSGKISWPSDPGNANFPAWMVHDNLQDKDFQEIQTGDPLFVDLDGNIVAYNGSHGSPVLLMFVNEGGYYYASSGTGISVARKLQYNLESGLLIPEEDEKKYEL